MNVDYMTAERLTNRVKNGMTTLAKRVWKARVPCYL